MNQIILAVVLSLALGALVVQLVAMLRGDGYGHRPPPRSHRDEVGITQHEQLRRLAR